MQKMEDVELVRRVATEEHGAYDALLDRIGPVVDRRLARAMARFPAAAPRAEDLRQEFLTLLVERDYRVLRAFAGRSRLETYVHAIATRFFWRRAREEVKKVYREDAVESDGLENPSPSPQQDVLRMSQIEGVRSVIDGLSNGDQILLKLLFEQEANATAVGRVLGMSPAGVRMKKRRLLAKLGPKLAHLWA